jgi:hypothetical protein
LTSLKTAVDSASAASYCVISALSGIHFITSAIFLYRKVLHKNTEGKAVRKLVRVMALISFCNFCFVFAAAGLASPWTYDPIGWIICRTVGMISISIMSLGQVRYVMIEKY